MQKQMLVIGITLRLWAASPVLSQSTSSSIRGEDTTITGDARLMWGGGFSVARPAGEFARAAQAAPGMDVHGLVRLGQTGTFALRFDGGVERYGHQHKKVPFSAAVGDLVTYDVETANEMYWFGVGPALMATRGPLRPYATSWIGACDFNTNSSVKNEGDGKEIASSNNFDHWTFEYGGGVGTLIRLTTTPSVTYIDVGARFHHNGQASYLVPGAIEQLPGGGLQMHPTTSAANFWSFHIGFSFDVPTKLPDRGLR